MSDDDPLTPESPDPVRRSLVLGGSPAASVAAASGAAAQTCTDARPDGGPQRLDGPPYAIALSRGKRGRCHPGPGTQLPWKPKGIRWGSGTTATGP